MTLIAALWRGERPLGMTYWLFGVFIYLGIDFGLRMLAATGIARSEQPLEIVVAILLLLVIAAYLVFISVAIMRSAANYQGNPMWAMLARISVVLAAITTLAPSPAARSPMALPIPRLAPVMKRVLSLRSGIDEQSYVLWGLR